ncbi:DUF2330 domain-containing protein [Haliangium ochraceum]|uniref:DUF2330 domain-containing protein n=1 Tax=Haliangium ochraceum TaxID=80816 RepID=UPI00019BAED7|nr:DUF2330 domain-containing protein [Haliangium ochraceum]
MSLIRTLSSAALGLVGALSLGALAGQPALPSAQACGCFAQPDPTAPVVQGGERIVFAMEDGVVTAHIQIQYTGAAEEFAWLLPLPSEPSFTLGNEEMFARLIDATQPRYRLGPRIDPETCPAPPPPVAAPGGPDSGNGPVVRRELVGPYEGFILSAEDKQPLLDWLSDNRFFVATDGDDALDPYIRAGGYFLAIRLAPGYDAGDLQPVVVSYRSELPQIPIVLTSISALADMPIMVWVLGEHRAIPRNFFHTQINDARIDWLNNAANYVEVVTDAVDEAEGHHSFVTEYAGTSEVMRDRLDYTGRFGDPEELRALSDPGDYLEYLLWHGYQEIAPNGAEVVSAPFVSLVEEFLPLPPELVAAIEADIGETITAGALFWDYRYWLEQYPDILGPAHAEFDADGLTDVLIERIVEPLRQADALFDEHPYLTRMFTTLSPDEMLKDPAFSFNPDLDEVSNIHIATVEILECAESSPDFDGPTILTTEQGRRLYFPNGLDDTAWQDVGMPASLRTEVLREEGAPMVVSDNAAAIDSAIDEYRPVPAVPDPDEDEGGCAAAPGTGTGPHPGTLLLVLLLGGLAAVARRRGRER